MRAAQALPLQSATEGTQMDLLEPSKSWQEVLRLPGCNGEACLFDFLLISAPLLRTSLNFYFGQMGRVVDVAMLNGMMIHSHSSSVS